MFHITPYEEIEKLDGKFIGYKSLQVYPLLRYGTSYGHWG